MIEIGCFLFGIIATTTGLFILKASSETRRETDSLDDQEETDWQKNGF